MYFLISVGLLFLTLTFLFIKKVRKNASYMISIPGTGHNPVTGNIPDFLGNTETILTVLQGYIKSYGPLVKINMGPTILGLIASDEKFLEHILSSNILIDKAEQYEYLHNWLGTGLLTSSGTKWKKHRRLITPSFHFEILGNFIEIFEKNGDVLVGKLKKETGKTCIDIYPHINLCTLDIICESAMGTAINAQQSETSVYVKCVKMMSKIAVERTIFPIPNYLYPLTPNYYREKNALKVLHAYTNDVIDKKIKFMNENGRFSYNPCMVDEVGKKKKIAFLDMLLNSQIDGFCLTKDEIREEVDTFMFGGHDTTSAAISFTIFAIANNYEVQEKLLEEQRHIFTDIKTAKPEMRHLQDMKYMELVIKESLRMYPPVCFLGRQLKEDHQWNGNVYPEGLNIFLFIYDNLRNPKYFSDPLKFKPERFEKQKLINPYIYIPFSAGPRNCIGQKYAMLEMKSILSKIIRKYELNPACPTHHLELVPDIILQSKNGVCISIKERM